MTYSIKSLKKLTVSGLALLLLPTASLAGTYYDAYIGGSLGASIGKLGDDNPTIRFATTVDQYPVTSNSSTVAELSLNTGFEFLNTDKGLSFALGLGVYRSAWYKYKGNLVESVGGSTPTSLYNYSFNVISTRVLVEGQINWILGHFAPYINAGVGGGWNDARGYKEIANTGTSFPPLAPFASNTKSSLSYQFGIGISYLFNAGKNKSRIQQERVSIGYRYVRVGNVIFGSRGSTYPYSLDTGVMKANDVYISFTHYF